MQTLLINPKSKEEFRFISDLLKKRKVSSYVLSEEEVEDLGMLLVLNEADRSQRVSRKTILKKLKT